ncbi:MAG: hypothetical protein O7B99_05770 [Planctomycetota bacterium]|nr:hypothetical protein [Planctomycetota bacterium]
MTIAALLFCLQASADLAEDLRTAIALPTPDERRAAALELARRDVELEAWLAAARGFGMFEETSPGMRTETVPLWVGEAELEDTQLTLYVPAIYDPATPAPLLLALHWTGGSGRSLHQMWSAVAEELGLLILSPSDPGANVGYTFSPRERLATLEALRWMRQRFNVDENRVFATGISRGGHLAWDLALRHPDILAAMAPMIGGPRIQVAGGENNVRYMENVVGLPIRDLQGSNDDPILVFNLRLAFERLEGWDAPDARLIEFPELGHSYDPRVVDWRAFWGGAVRDPVPERVVRCTAREGEGRAFWVDVLAVTDEVADEFMPEVKKSRWEKMDRFERLAYVQGEADERTARLEATLTPSGRIKVVAKRVEKFRLLLTEEMAPKREVLVSYNRKTIRRRKELSKEVLLLEFVERFDRTFLPVIEVKVP